MKKILFLGLSLCLGTLTLTSKAQSTTTTANDIKFGIKAGGNYMSSGKFDVGGVYYEADLTPGFQAGVFVEIPLNAEFTFAPEAIFSQKGSKFKGTAGNNTGEIKSKVGYIDIPVLFAYNATPQLHFILGPQASFFTHQDTKILANGQEVSANSDSDNFRGSVVGGVAGVGYKFTPNINLNARYSMDFQSFAKENINQDKAKFSGFALSLGYSF